MLLDDLRGALKHAMKNKEPKRVSAYRVIIGELTRLDSKEPSDSTVLKVLKKLSRDEKMVIGSGESTVFLDVVESYLPKQMTKEEILEYINVFDLSKFKNRMQAMSLIMKGLDGRANGNDVKEVLLTFK